MIEKKDKYLSQKKYATKNNLISKTYKLNKQVVEDFTKACKINNESQASVLTKLMKTYINN